MTLNPEAERTQLVAPDMTIDQSLARVPDPVPQNKWAQTSGVELRDQTQNEPTTATTQIATPVSEEQMIAAADEFMGDLELQTDMLVNLPWMEIVQREERLVEELNETRQEVEKVRTKYQEELRRRGQDLSSAKSEIKDLTEQCKQTEQALEQLQTEHRVVSISETQLRKDCETLQQQLSATEEKHNSLVERCDHLTNEVEQLSEKNKQLMEEISIFQNMKIEWENEKLSMSSLPQISAEATGSLELQIEELSAKLLIKESDYSDLEAKVETLQDLHAEQLGKTQALLDSEIQSRLVLQQENSLLDLKISELVSKCSELERNLAAEKTANKPKPVPSIPPHIQKHYDDMERKYIQAKRYVTVDTETLEMR